MIEGSILYNIKDGHCFILLVGRITYKISSNFDDFVRQILKKENIDSFLIDLRQTEHIDSTGLGLLAKIAIHSSQNNKDQPIIVSNNEDINIILDSMGFFDVFLIIESFSEFSSHFEDISSTFQINVEKTKTILQAHEALMFLNQKNKDIFQDVVVLLKDELEEN